MADDAAYQRIYASEMALDSAIYEALDAGVTRDELMSKVEATCDDWEDNQ